jgi:hypothetical protein
MKPLSFFSIATLALALFTLNACQKNANELFESPAPIWDQMNHKGALGTGANDAGDFAQVVPISKNPYVFEVRKFNAQRRLLGTATYNLEAPFMLVDPQASILPDQSVQVTGTLLRTDNQMSEVFQAKFDKQGDILWNTKASTESAVDYVDQIDDPEEGSFIHIKQKNDDGTESYVIVYICTEGLAEYGTQLIQAHGDLKNQVMYDEGELVQIEYQFADSAARIWVDKKDGRVKDVNLGHSGIQMIPGHGTSVPLKTGSVRMRRLQSTDRLSGR